MSRTYTSIILAIILLGIGLRVYYGAQKEYFHHDEIFTFELINDSHWASQRTADSNYNKVINGDIFRSDINIEANEQFKYSEFTNVIKKDVHPPLYYWLLHPVQVIISNGEYGKWPGLILNIFLYVISTYFIFKISQVLCRRPYFSLFPPAIFAIAPGFITISMFIRMYELLALTGVMLLYYTLLFITEKAMKKKNLILIGAALVLGGLTNYYFFIYAFFLCLTTIAILVVRKKYSIMKYYVLTIVGSAVAYLLIWPASIKQVFSSKLGSTLIEDSSLIDNLLVFTVDILFSLRNILLVRLPIFLLPLLLLSIVYIIRNKATIRRLINRKMAIISIPLFLTFLLVEKTHPFNTMRYVFNLLPMFLLLIYYLSINLIRMSKRKKYVVFSVVVALFLAYLPFGTIDYLYKARMDDKTLFSYFYKDGQTPVIIFQPANGPHSFMPAENEYWTLIKLIPALVNKENIYLANKTNLSSDDISEVLQQLGSPKKIYILTNQDIKGFSKFYKYLLYEPIRYKTLYLLHNDHPEL